MNSKIKDYAESDTLYRLLEEIIEISNRTNKIKSDLKKRNTWVREEQAKGKRKKRTNKYTKTTK